MPLHHSPTNSIANRMQIYSLFLIPQTFLIFLCVFNFILYFCSVFDFVFHGTFLKVNDSFVQPLVKVVALFCYIMLMKLSLNNNCRTFALLKTFLYENILRNRFI